jgi:hypothetical protein
MARALQSFGRGTTNQAACPRKVQVGPKLKVEPQKETRKWQSMTHPNKKTSK